MAEDEVRVEYYVRSSYISQEALELEIINIGFITIFLSNSKQAISLRVCLWRQNIYDSLNNVTSCNNTNNY